MRGAIIGAVLVAALLMPLAGRAGVTGDGLSLLAACSTAMDIAGFGAATKDELRDLSPKQWKEAGYCEGLILGLAFGMGEAKTICLPSDFTLGQLVLVVKKHLSDNPAELHKSGAGLAGAALVYAFHCPAES